MTAFTQEAKDHGNKMLDELISMVHAAAIETCKGGLDDARDDLYKGLGHLYQAKGILGGVNGPEVSTRMGGK